MEISRFPSLLANSTSLPPVRGREVYLLVLTREISRILKLDPESQEILTISKKNSHFYLTLLTDLPHAEKRVLRKVDTCGFDRKKLEVNRKSGHDCMNLSTRGHAFLG